MTVFEPKQLQQQRLVIACILLATVFLGCTTVVSSLKRGRTLNPSLPQPTYPIQPTPYPAYDDGGILDFALTGDFMTDTNISVYISGFELVWPWDTFHCAFDHRGATSVGVATLEGLGSNPAGERMIFCPVPETVISAVRHSGLRAIVFSVFADPHNATAIIDGVQLAIYKKTYHDIVMHTMIKDVGGELVQWIEYHRLLGVQHFYLYDNSSGDNTRMILQRYVRRGLVTLVHWPFLKMYDRPWMSVQRVAMNHFLKNWGRFSRWAGMFDVDEYFQPSDQMAERIQQGNDTLVTLLDEAFPDTCGAQFWMWDVSCRPPENMRQRRNERYTFLIQACSVFTNAELQHHPEKMWLRPDTVKVMLNIHGLHGDPFYPKQQTADFGRFRHYHYGVHNKEDGEVDHSMERWLAPLHAVCDSHGC